MASEVDTKSVVSTGEWFIYLCVLTIPVINLVVILWDAFGPKRNENKRNFCRATLILIVLTTIIMVICSVLLMALFESIFGSLKEMFNNTDLGGLGSFGQLFQEVQPGQSPEIDQLLKQYNDAMGQ